MYKNILALFFVFVLSLIFSTKASASSVLFSDSFDEAADSWIPTSGNWVVREGKYGAVASNPSENASSIANVDLTTPNYTIELDMYPIQGIDRTIRFRFGSNINVYDVHFTSDGIATNFGLDNHSFVLGNHPFNDNHGYHIKVVLKGQHFQFYIDENLIFDKVDTNYLFDGHEQFGLIVATGSVPTEVYFDNINITTDDYLDVPLFKQNDPLWADDVYDSANEWSSVPTMARWGCALTSAAMVLKYHNVDKLPDGTDLTPATLNDYFKSSPDGWFRNGLVNFQRAAILARDAKGQNPDFAYDALEFERGGTDSALLQSDIDDENPVILEALPSTGRHFVVAKGVDESNIYINDPYFELEDLSEYGNEYSSTRRLIPSNTDLSYIILVTDPEVDIVLKDSEGNSIGEAIVEDPISDPTGESTGTGGLIKTLYFPKPQSGNYTIEVDASSGNYQLDEYYYDLNGEVKMFSHSGGFSEDTIQVSFDKEEGDNTQSNKVENVTFDSIKQKIKDGYSDGKIKFGTRLVLLVQLEIAERARKDKIQKGALNLMILLISKDKKMDDELAEELTEDITTLKESL